MHFVLPPFEENGLPFWVPGVLCQHSEVVLWKLLNIQMIFEEFVGEKVASPSYSSAILELHLSITILPLPPQRAGLAPRAWQPALRPAPCHTPGRHCSPSLPLPGEWGPPPGLALLLCPPEGDPRIGKRGLTTSGRFGGHRPPDSIPTLLALTGPCYLGPLEEFSLLYMTLGK